MFSKIFKSLDRIADGVDSINKSLNKYFTINDLNFLISDNQLVRVYLMSNVLGSTYKDVCVWSGKFEYIPFEYLKEDIYKIAAHEDGSIVFILNVDYHKKMN